MILAFVGSSPATAVTTLKGGEDMLVSEAAKKMGMNTQCLRLALQQGKFPFGQAIKSSENRYVYYINEERLEKYLRGDDMTVR